MAYKSSTNASSVANPPKLLVPSIGAFAASSAFSSAAVQRQYGGALWHYVSTHSSTAVIAANFFSDGKKLGMKVGDAVWGVQFSTAGSSGKVYHGTVKTVSTSGATLSGSILFST